MIKLNRKKLTSMLSVDFRRMFTMPLIYILVGISLVMPILILIMTTTMAGTTSVNPTTGAETTMEGFKNVWQIIGSVSSGFGGGGADMSSAGMGAMSMDLTSMCNINLIFFAAAVLVCLFVADDFRSGFAKNLFTVRPNKHNYIISKTLVCFAGSVMMLVAFFVGSMIGGAIAGLPFTLEGVNAFQIVMCMLSKIFLMLVFVSIYLIASVFAKQKAWLSILLSLGGSMLMFAMIPMITPLNASIINVILCLAGGAGFAIGLGVLSNLILKKTSLV